MFLMKPVCYGSRTCALKVLNRDKYLHFTFVDNKSSTFVGNVWRLYVPTVVVLRRTSTSKTMRRGVLKLKDEYGKTVKIRIKYAYWANKM